MSTLEAWAARVAPTMDADMWRTCEAHAERSGPSLGRMPPEKARALLVHRDKARQQRYQARGSTVFFFGCGRGPGHHWYGPGLKGLQYSDIEHFPWGGGEIDGRLQPDSFTITTHGREQVHTGPQIQGPAKLHYRKGWTLLAFWDRSVDTRGGCNGNFLAEGLHDFGAMLALAVEHFPTVVARLSVPLHPEGQGPG